MAVPAFGVSVSVIAAARQETVYRGFLPPMAGLPVCVLMTRRRNADATGLADSASWHAARYLVLVPIAPGRPERHRFDRIGWLRAAVLGANDGIVSTASLLMGVAGSGADKGAVVIAGVAGLVAGAMSMAAGEYVSVSAQSDTEEADIAIEKRELATQAEAELHELASIYVGRGLDAGTALTVARQLTAHDALGAHMRDELGFADHARARPLQAAFASAATFAVGAALPLVAAWLSPRPTVAPIVFGMSLAVLVVLGATSARAVGASPARGALRVTFWGVFAMVLTYGVGRLFGAVV